MNFIEIPILVAKNSDDTIDYESLGLDAPDAETETVKALINLDIIERVNSIDNEKDYKCVLWCSFDESYRTPYSYDKIKIMINDTKNLSR